MDRPLILKIASTVGFFASGEKTLRSVSHPIYLIHTYTRGAERPFVFQKGGRTFSPHAHIHARSRAAVLRTLRHNVF